VAAVGRRVTTLCKGEDGLHQQLALYHVYHNFCLPHTALRQPLPQPELTKGTGSAKQWQLQTPAMAAALTDHVWTLREVLLFRVPPWPLCFARKVCRFARKVCRLASKRQKMAHGTASGSAPQALPKGPHNTIPTSSCDLSSPKNVTLPQRFVAKHKGSWAECIEKVR